MNETKPTSALKVVLFTDLIDSTGWKKLGDQAYLVEIHLPHDRLFRELLAQFSRESEGFRRLARGLRRRAASRFSHYQRTSMPPLPVCDVCRLLVWTV